VHPKVAPKKPGIKNEDRPLPANPDAEGNLLGSVLAGTVRFETLADKLDAGDFSNERHRRIFACMGELHHRGDHINGVSVADELTGRGQLEHDSISYFADLVTDKWILPDDRSAAGAIRMVREASMRRKTMIAAQSIVERVSISTENVAEVLAGAREMFEELRTAHEPASAVFEVDDVESLWTFDAGIEWLIVGILARRTVNLLSGDAGIGKSTLALKLAGDVAHGWEFLGRATAQARVLYLDRELGGPGQGKARTFGDPRDARSHYLGRMVRKVSRGPGGRGHLALRPTIQAADYF
jgi:hypothetical protein